MKNKDFIEIVFENCDYIILTSEYLNHLYLGDVMLSYSTLIDKDSGKISLINSLVVSNVKIEVDLKLRSSGLTSAFGKDSYERLLNLNDITQIWTNFSGKREQFFVYWDEEDDYSNRFQLNELNEDEGNLVITISKELPLKGIFLRL